MMKRHDLGEMFDDWMRDKGVRILPRPSEPDLLELWGEPTEAEMRGWVKNGHCLLAISGDCSAGGLDEQPDFLPLLIADFPLTKRYLRCQLEVGFLASRYSDPAGDLFDADEFSEAVRELNDLGNRMIERGIFSHKWHKRTTWALWELDEGGPLNHPNARRPMEGGANETS